MTDTQAGQGSVAKTNRGKMPLSYTQFQILETMNKGRWYTSRDLNTRTFIMEDLTERGILERKRISGPRGGNGATLYRLKDDAAVPERPMASTPLSTNGSAPIPMGNPVLDPRMRRYIPELSPIALGELRKMDAYLEQASESLRKAASCLSQWEKGMSGKLHRRTQVDELIVELVATSQLLEGYMAAGAVVDGKEFLHEYDRTNAG